MCEGPQPEGDLQPAPQERKQAGPKPARKIGKSDEKSGRGTKPPAAPKAKRLSCIDAAAQIIGKDAIGCRDLIAEMGQRGLWKSPNGRTPSASLYSALIREIAAKGRQARFRKVDRGLFVANSDAKKGASAMTSRNHDGIDAPFGGPITASGMATLIRQVLDLAIEAATDPDDGMYELAEPLAGYEALICQDAGIPTDDAGLVIRATDGREFQITVVRSR